VDIERIIFIDDDRVNNSLSKIIVRQAIGSFDVYTFENPKEALEFIMREYAGLEKPLLSLVLLDINMPVMSGWNFLDKVSDFPETVKDSLRIHILSSSIDQRDKDRAERHPLVESYISKPLVTNTLRSLVYPKETLSSQHKDN